MRDSTPHYMLTLSIVPENEHTPGRSIAFANNEKDVMKFKEFCKMMLEF